MEKRALYKTPDGFDNLEVSYGSEGVCGIRFTSSKEETVYPQDPSFLSAKSWLDSYFNARPLPFCPFSLRGITSFQKMVYEETMKIPFGQTRSYGSLSQAIRKTNGLTYVSPRAVGQALKKNPILLWVPCHRILCLDGSLGGYAGGVENKASLLKFETDFAPIYEKGEGHEN